MPVSDIGRLLGRSEACTQLRRGIPEACFPLSHSLSTWELRRNEPTLRALSERGGFQEFQTYRSITFQSISKSISNVFNIPTLIHPDIYNATEKHAAEKFKFHSKVMDMYYKQRPLTSWNLYKNENEGWDELERRTRYFWNRMWIQRVCRQSLWGFSDTVLKTRAIQIYKEVNTALANGHKGRVALEGIKEMVSPALFDQLLGESVKLQKTGRMVEWKMIKEPGVEDLKLVNAYMMKPATNLQAGSVKLNFVQWTVEINSEQCFAVYEKKQGKGGGQKLIAGDPQMVIKVVDHWVFERPILKSWFIPRPGPRGAEWRLVARLIQPQGRPPVQDTSED
ncbi:hypothetical protein CEUSTIGMA_g8005.t1 [Chlamydomonas eustigma]|uniref:Large ribosomal subunit protein mL45 n=1 Tax=Chlamydomonas eustigma TaxID=1157962 RepID=A0A250XBV9_9CHLO|nr:hypothetical protein CEUSTIGMA_g8005.t1 [Chlamydomonas eustigma]|eukprot:GAX80568.1 hypothetical protein CEUSTIGMA_g8005.t1 [Chlamydomonas eustigma]